MITMTDDMLQKISLLDRFFGAMSVEQLTEFTESEQIVARLKGTDQNPGLLAKLVKENEQHSTDLIKMNSEITVLKSDLQYLIRSVNTLSLASIQMPYSQDLQSLKSKYNIY
jgi:hypothetical protein